MSFKSKLQLSAIFLPFLLTICAASLHPVVDYLIKDEISYMNFDKEYLNTKTGNSLTLECHIGRICLTTHSAACTDPGTTRWFVPNSLPARDNSTRKQILFRYKVIGSDVVNKTTSFNITTTLKLMKIGFAHAGRYECSSILEQLLFSVVVDENDQHNCDFHDQCKSYNCYSNKCQCKTSDENYDSSSKQCVFRKLLGESCQADIDCAIGNKVEIEPEFLQNLSKTRCVQNSTTGFKTCQCEMNSVKVNLATATIDACLPKSTFGGICYSNAQCQSSPNDGSFCGLDMKTLGKSPNLNLLICQCKDGWRQSVNGSQFCTPYSKCDSTQLGFNEHFKPGGGCTGSNQFCRNNYCLCMPNYEFNADGDCITQMGIDGQGKSWLEEYFIEILIGIGLAAVILVTFGVIHLIARNFVYKRRKQAPKNEVQLNGARYRY